MKAPTHSQLEVLRLVAEGLSNKEIAARRHCSEHTVKFHVQSLFAHWECSTRVQLVVLGLKAEYLRLGEIP